MAQSAQLVFCDACKKEVQVQRQSQDIAAQVVFSLFTFGLWLPIWFLLWRSSPMVCVECGHVVDCSLPSVASPALLSAPTKATRKRRSRGRR